MYGKTAKEANDTLAVRVADVRRGILVPERSWTVGAYLDYWIRDAAPKRLRPSTIQEYEAVIRLYAKPLFGSRSLVHMSVASLQKTFDQQLAKGMSVSRAIHVKTVLMSMLSNAMREDLVIRNVARLVSVGQREPKPFTPWNADEVSHFLRAIRSDRLYPAFLLPALYGMRVGEILGLRWSDIDWDQGVIRVRQQLICVHNEVRIGPPKTKRSKRNLPLLEPVRNALTAYRNTMTLLGIEPIDDWDLVFRDRTGRPIETYRFSRLFHKRAKQAGLRRTRLHGFRHSAATILKNLRVPDRDIKAILGHSKISVTQDFYEHADLEVQQKGLTQLEQVLLRQNEGDGGRQPSPSSVDFVNEPTSVQSVGRPTTDTLTLRIPYFNGLASDPTLTPVIHHLRARTNSHIFGSLAVRFTVKNDHPDEPNSMLWQWISLHDALAPQPRHFVDRLAVTAAIARRHP